MTNISDWLKVVRNFKRHFKHLSISHTVFCIFFLLWQVPGPARSDTVGGFFNFLSKYPVQFDSFSPGIHRSHHEDVVTSDASCTTHLGR